VGFVTEVTPVPFLLIFERAPVWLLALEPSICLGVYFTGIENAYGLLKLLNDQGCDPTQLNQAVTRLGVGRVHFDGSAPPPALATTLISGSHPFLQKAAAETRSGRNFS
jgi:hypothetical protein